MSGEPDIAVPARALGDPARGRIVSALLGNRAIPAGELARIAGLSASTTSEHLRVLADAEIIIADQRGRNRYYRLTGSDVSHAIEALQAIAPQIEARSLRQHRVSEELRQARTCYDHVAGDLGLRLTDLLVRQKIITELAVGCVTHPPQPFPNGPVATMLGIRPPRGRRPWARGCPDWTGRRPHVAGQVGAQILTALQATRWITSRVTSRAVELTEAGERGLHQLEAL
ncbi:MAG: helix-turn-helix transcriptional regulator [Actinomycetota bacterium]|nr:helix-turn-helix transcriptional regulator [Actinomycetota bacterium]